MRLSKQAWQSVIVDGAECLGCFYSERKKEYSLKGDVRTYTECWIEMPDCQCNCRVYCGSKVEYKGKLFSAIGDAQQNLSTGCTIWYLEEDCNAC